MDLSELPQGSFQRHPWENSRQRFFTAVLASSGSLERTHHVLDAGAGDGWFSAQLLTSLPRDAQVLCWDAHYTTEQLQRLSHSSTQQRFTAELPKALAPSEGAFDLLLLLDVLEHVEDDLAFLRGLVESLRDGARALISVPAWSALYSRHDRRLRHFRRYQPQQCADVIARAGLRIERRGGLFHSLLGPRAATRLREQWSPRDDDNAVGAEPSEVGAWRHGRLLTRAVEGALALDNACSQLFSRWGVDVPGLSWWALCQKPSR
jgi:SAM-dependent methyltransferase